MARTATKQKPKKSLKQTLWEAADELRGNQEPSEYKHVVLGLVFLKNISDCFEERRQELDVELIAEDIKAERLLSFLEGREMSARAIRVLGTRERTAVPHSINGKTA